MASASGSLSRFIERGLRCSVGERRVEQTGGKAGAPNFASASLDSVLETGRDGARRSDTWSTIALSVVLAALNNLKPLVAERRWAVAFAFGLIHGFGFASVLADLGLPQGTLLLALVGFNLGVEAGQLAIVGAFLPLAYALRGTWLYRRLVFTGGSAAIALVAAVWLAERVFDIKLWP
jgi:hypothetical protein